MPVNPAEAISVPTIETESNDECQTTLTKTEFGLAVWVEDINGGGGATFTKEQFDDFVEKADALMGWNQKK